ncbi:MAG: hypothetical protein J6L76_01770, partial [Clostridia bacterium]|nr:hypothetical protein [Clostridia bacterium]
MKRTVALLACFCLLVGMVLPGMVWAEESSLTEIVYDVNNVTLSAPGTAYNVNPIFTSVPNGVTDGSYKPGCLNDGVYVRPSFAQIEYLGIPYVNGKLVESFYI